MNIHPDDLLHVILDALNEHQHQIAHGLLEPWLHYEAFLDEGSGDPKTTSDGYLAVLALATTRVTDMLSRSIPLPEANWKTIANDLYEASLPFGEAVLHEPDGRAYQALVAAANAYAEAIGDG